jgi:valacyclovir hydrolase
VADTQLHVVTAGSGPPVLLLPGALGTAETDFGPQIAALSKRYTVVSFDPRGYGKSTVLQGRTFPVDFYARDARDAAALMASLGYGEYSVLGWSDGANSGVHLASMHPERVTKLAIWGANTHYGRDDIAAFEATRDVASSWSPRMRASLEEVYGAEELQRMWSEACDAWKEIERGGGNVCGEEARSVSCPTLILHGALDPMVTQSHPEALHAAIPESELVVLPKGKHNLHLRYAREVNGILMRFLGA